MNKEKMNQLQSDAVVMIRCEGRDFTCELARSGLYRKRETEKSRPLHSYFSSTFLREVYTKTCPFVFPNCHLQSIMSLPIVPRPLLPSLHSHPGAFTNLKVFVDERNDIRYCRCSSPLIA